MLCYILDEVFVHHRAPSGHPERPARAGLEDEEAEEGDDQPGRIGAVPEDGEGAEREEQPQEAGQVAGRVV